MDLFIDPAFEDDYRAHPIVLADVGARGGLKANWSEAARHLRVIAFEPDPREFARLATADDAGRSLVLPTALHKEQATLPLYVARDRGLTSIFPPNRAFLDAFPEADRFDTMEVRHLDVDTLDHQLDAHHIEDVDFIKVDTQGSELFVLQGASDTLARWVVGVEVEVEFAPIYQGQPLFDDVDRHLRGLGFHLFNLRRVHWKRDTGRTLGGPYGQVVWADALYLKQLPVLSAMVTQLRPQLRRSKILRAISVCLLYGYCDYALAIARSAADQLSSQETGLIESRIAAMGRPGGSLPPVPGRRQLAALFKRLWKACRPPADGWSVSDAEVGNRE